MMTQSVTSFIYSWLRLAGGAKGKRVSGRTAGLTFSKPAAITKVSSEPSKTMAGQMTFNMSPLGPKQLSPSISMTKLFARRSHRTPRHVKKEPCGRSQSSVGHL
ncbi:uncharacterized [Tachysurus ichikawai]